MATNLDDYAPFDSGVGKDVTEDKWRAMMRRGNIAGTVKNAGSELKVFADSTGRQVKIPVGEVVIESYWGTNNTTKTMAITANATGSTRYDLVIARADWVNDVVQFDVLTGTTVPPTLTRDASKWEVPLAVVTVGNGVSTINPADVADARQWGGPPVMTVTDDFSLYGDRISSCRRFDITGDNAHVNTNLYVTRMHSLGEQTVSEIRMYPTVLPVAGTVQVRIFRGLRGDQLTQFVDPTTSTFLYGGSASTVHTSAIPVTTFRAGEMIVVAVRAASTSTAPNLATNAVTAGAGTVGNLITPANNFVTGFKTTTMPTTLNILDGTWFQRDRVFWVALA